MYKQLLPWGLLLLAVIILTIIGIKSCNNIPDVNPYELKINELKSELQIEKTKTDSLGKIAQNWESLYREESKKPKKIIIRTNEKVDSVKHLPIDSSLKYFQQWTRDSVPGI